MAGETVRGEISFVRGGEPRHFVNILAPLWQDGMVRGIVGVNLDITDSRRMEQQAERAQRIESLGVLAGGIAHDFNNLLAVILGNVSLARRSLSPGGEAAAYLADAERAHLDARALTRQLLTFAQGGAPLCAVTSPEC